MIPENPACLWTGVSPRGRRAPGPESQARQWKRRAGLGKAAGAGKATEGRPHPFLSAPPQVTLGMRCGVPDTLARSRNLYWAVLLGKHGGGVGWRVLDSGAWF